MSAESTESPKNYHELRKSVVDLLGKPEGEKMLQSRRAKIAQVAKVAELNRPDVNWRLRNRNGVWFSITQGQAIQANNDTCTLSVQMLGREIGKLKINKNATSRYCFKPQKRYEAKRECWDWSRNREHGEKIRTFLARLRKNWENKQVQEREIQWQLAQQLGNANPLAALRNLQAVRWLGYPTEIGVSLNRTGKLKTGTIDLLVRRLGGNPGAQFLVFEVKRPSAKRTRVNRVKADLESALKQALYYALALHREANENKDTRATYRKAFGSMGADKLSFGAVVVMENTDANIEAGIELLKKFKPPNETQDSRAVDRLGMLLYKWDGETKKACGWTWLEGWNPR